MTELPDGRLSCNKTEIFVLDCVRIIESHLHSVYCFLLWIPFVFKFYICLGSFCRNNYLASVKPHFSIICYASSLQRHTIHQFRKVGVMVWVTSCPVIWCIPDLIQCIFQTCCKNNQAVKLRLITSIKLECQMCVCSYIFHNNLHKILNIHSLFCHPALCKYHHSCKAQENKDLQMNLHPGRQTRF